VDHVGDASGGGKVLDPERVLEDASFLGTDIVQQRERAWRGYQAGLDMVRDGLIPEHSFWGTINCNGVNWKGEVCGVTTTSGLAWKIPGRVGDSPILGAGLYVDGDVGAGSDGDADCKGAV